MGFIVNSIKIRAVAVYMPHCGYLQEEYDTTFEQLKCIVAAGKRKQRRIIIGGDFNAQIGRGIRGDSLRELQN